MATTLRGRLVTDQIWSDQQKVGVKLFVLFVGNNRPSCRGEVMAVRHVTCNCQDLEANADGYGRDATDGTDHRTHSSIALPYLDHSSVQGHHGTYSCLQ
jgi:hypothetical protein